MLFCKGPFRGEGKLRGSVLFVVIGAIIVMSVIGAALSRLHGSGTETEIQENRVDDAYYAAISGINYATATMALKAIDPSASGWTPVYLQGIGSRKRQWD